MNAASLFFLRRLVLDRPPDRRSDLAKDFARDEALGTIKGARVVYSDQDYVRAASMIVTRGYALEAAESGFSRSDAPPGGSEKHGALPVAKDLVAVMPLGMDTHAPAGGFLAMPWQNALSLPFEVLLVCENLESFLQLGQYRWLADMIKERPTLGLFRGMVRTFGTDGAAQLVKHDNRPVLAFFDYDPRGLAMAASLPRREALCLPPWEILEPAVIAARRDHLYSNSYAVSQAQLDKVQDADIALAWKRMKMLTKGLNQEAFPRK